MTSPIDLNPRSLQTVERILADYVPHCEVRAYGSRARWEAKDYSDLDLAVVGDGPTDPRILGDLREAFEESDLPIRVEVVDWHAIDEAFRSRIEPDCVVIQRPPKRAGWRDVEIGQIADVVGGGTPSTGDPNNFNGDIPWLTPKDLSGQHDRYVAHGARNLSQAGLDNSSAKLLPADSVLLSTRAPIGYVALAKNPIATNQGFRSLVVQDEAAPEYLYYWLKLHTHELERHASGTTFRELSGSSLKKIRVRLPQLDEQRSIADVLGALDDKIELNRRMSETLEEMAQTLFRSWFVDFNPVRAKAEGRPSGLPSDLDVLFPDSFESSELGKIPTGWDVKTLGDAFHITMGQSPPGETYNEAGDGIPFYQGRADFGFRFPTRRVYCTSPRRLANANDTLVSVRAPVGDVNVATEPCCVGRGLAAVRHHDGNHSFTFYSMQALSRTFELFEAEGTVFGSLNKKEFRSLPWISPPQSLIAHFEAICSTLDGRIGVNAKANIALAALRDTLLPRLLSGELRVRGTEQAPAPTTA